MRNIKWIARRRNRRKRGRKEEKNLMFNFDLFMESGIARLYDESNIKERKYNYLGFQKRQQCRFFYAEL